jgi:hypothetical protein
MRVLTASLLIVGGLAACHPLPGDTPAPLPGGVEGGLAFYAERASYTAGDRVSVRLVNGTSAQIGYNLCPSRFQRWSEGSWVDAPNAGGYEACTMELRTLNPGQHTSLEIPLSSEARAGAYRLVTRVERLESGASATLETQPFEVRR